MEALKFANKYTSITNEDINIFMQAKNSLLFHKGKIWRKKGTGGFDNMMGSFDGAEICEIVGLYLLSMIKTLHMDTGLYRDDGLSITRCGDRESDILRKKLESLFKEKGLSITVQCNKYIIDFLDVTLDIRDGSFWPYVKENNLTKYVCIQSNHPPNVLNNIPQGINQRLNVISSSEELFKTNTRTHQEELRKSGYTFKLEYNKNEGDKNNLNKQKKRRKRKILWYNPPFNLQVKTNVGKKFLNILDESFPKRNPLSKIFNRNNVKLSYCTTSNLESFIAQHNEKILNAGDNQDNPPKDVINCSCPGKK